MKPAHPAAFLLRLRTLAARGSWARVLCGIGLGLGLASCSKPASLAESAQTVGSRSYQVRGIVRGAPDLVARTVTVQHEDVPGFMPAMTMDFAFRDSQEVAGIRVGETVAFTLVVAQNESWIAGVRRMGDAGLASPAPAPAAPRGNRIARLKEGDGLPDFELIDQAGSPIRRETFAGRLLLVTFIFTRCPIPEYCPLLGRNFRTLQQAIRANPDLAGRVSLLSVSFDEHDTPALLAQYGATLTDDLDSWRFATGAPAEVKKLTQAFAVLVQAEGGSISHGLATALIGTDGVIRHLWRGNGWKTDEVLAALRTLSTPGDRAE